jgi:hypothetical protein
MAPGAERLRRRRAAAEDTVVTTAPDSEDGIYIYPKDGQSPQQEATDRYECNRWAEGQTGFDPTRPRAASLPIRRRRSSMNTTAPWPHASTGAATA